MKKTNRPNLLVKPQPESVGMTSDFKPIKPSKLLVGDTSNTEVIEAPKEQNALNVLLREKTEKKPSFSKLVINLYFYDTTQAQKTINEAFFTLSISKDNGITAFYYYKITAQKVINLLKPLNYGYAQFVSNSESILNKVLIANRKF